LWTQERLGKIYDPEAPIILQERDPYFDEEMDVAISCLHQQQMIGVGEPIRVRQSQRVLLGSCTQAPPCPTDWSWQDTPSAKPEDCATFPMVTLKSGSHISRPYLPALGHSP
jgi:hypothetical protein